MAFYNPRPISFDANPAIIQSAGAVGNFFRDKAKSDFEEALRTEQANRANEIFKWQQDRAGVEDEKWQKSYDASREAEKDASEKWMSDGLRKDMYHTDDMKLREQGLTLQEKELKQREAERLQKEKELTDGYKAQGIINAMLHPEMARNFGAVKQVPAYGAPTTQTTINPLIASLAQPRGMSAPQGVDLSGANTKMSAPMYGTRDEYNTQALTNFGKVKIPEKTRTELKPIDLGGQKAFYDPYTGEVKGTLEKTANLLDKTKVAQQTVKALDNANGIAPIIERLIDNHDTLYTGPADTAAHWVGKYTPIGSDKMAQYKQDLTNITMFNKELANLGAALTPNEQALLQETLPDPTLDDNIYKSRLLNYTKTMRDIVRSKVDASDLAGYKTKDLSKIADKYDSLYQKAETRFGKPTSNSANKNVRQVVQDVEQDQTINAQNASSYGIKFNF